MTHISHRILSGITVFLTAFTCLAIRSLAFSDVSDPNVFYYDAVNWAAEEGITTGFDDGSFRPMSECNRASVVTFLWRLAGRPEAAVPADFSDLPANEDFAKAISWAAEEGITTGFDDGTFRPWQTCNRAAIVTFLWRYAGRPTVETSASFSDLPANEDFAAAISWAAEKGITTGFDDGTFRPWQTCNRLSVVSFLYRFRFRGGQDGPYSGCTAVCFGDSNAQDRAAAYPLRGNIFRQLRRILHITEWSNYGIGGATFQTGGVSGETLLKVIMDEVTQAPSEGADRVDLVVLIGGINDFHYCPRDAASFGAAVDMTLAAIAAKYPNAQIVTVFDGNDTLPNAAVLSYGRAMEQAAAGHSTARGGCIYVSLGDYCLRGVTGTEGSFYESTNHYNDAGAAAAADRIAAMLTGSGIGYVPDPLVTAAAYTEEAPSAAGAWNYSAVTTTAIDLAGCVRTDTHEVIFTPDFAAPAGVDAETGCLVSLPGTWSGEETTVQGEVFGTDPRTDPDAVPVGTVTFRLANRFEEAVWSAPVINVFPAESIPPGGALAEGCWVRLTLSDVIAGS
ncbi:MAG: S-layer homology domain-containing protein [Lachnospiraceae bacterium]|nr:S-layer homology domain-containing protein [Lachnospiraceae bacterium]